MYFILRTSKAITDAEFYKAQFMQGEIGQKKVLFVKPQLRSSHLYKFLLPYLNIVPERHGFCSAINGLDKYNPFEQIVSIGEGALYNFQIEWADFIVFPFTTDNLARPNYYYDAVREVNPKAKICFYVDYDFYNLPKEHKMYELFQNKDVVVATELNMAMADIVFASNYMLTEWLGVKIEEIIKRPELADTYRVEAMSTFSYFISSDIVTDNIANHADFFEKNPDLKNNPDFNIESISSNKTIVVHEYTDKILQVEIGAEKVKQKDLATKKTKIAKKVALKSAATKKGAKKGKVVAEKKPTIRKASTETKKVVPAPQVPLQQRPKPTYDLDKEYRFGIICSGDNNADLKAYNDVFKKINLAFGEKVKLIFVGYDKDADKHDCLAGVEYEYIKPVSIIHYFKQIEALALDYILICSEASEFNVRSENISRVLEAGIFGIPCFSPNIHPYQAIVRDYYNGFMYNKETIVEKIKQALDAPEAIKQDMKKKIIEGINRDYVFNEANIEGFVRSYLDLESELSDEKY